MNDSTGRFEAGHYGSCKIRPVGGLWNEDHVAVTFSTVTVIGLKKFQPDQFSLRSRHGLCRDCGQTRYFSEPSLYFEEDFQGTLRVLGR